MIASLTQNNNLFRSLPCIGLRDWLITNESNSTIRAEIMLRTVLKMGKSIDHRLLKKALLKNLPTAVKRNLDAPMGEEAYNFFKSIYDARDINTFYDRITTVIIARHCGYAGIDFSKKVNKQYCKNSNRAHCDFWGDHLTMSSDIANTDTRHISCEYLRYDISFPPLNGGIKLLKFTTKPTTTIPKKIA